LDGHQEGPEAITAAADKLARIIYAVVTRRVEYDETAQSHLHAPIELAQVRLVPAERFRRHPQRRGQSILRSFRSAGFDPGSGDGMFGQRPSQLAKAPQIRWGFRFGLAF
jgi:hypothetical protein